MYEAMQLLDAASDLVCSFFVVGIVINEYSSHYAGQSSYSSVLRSVLLTVGPGNK